MPASGARPQRAEATGSDAGHRLDPGSVTFIHGLSPPHRFPWVTCGGYRPAPIRLAWRPCAGSPRPLRDPGVGGPARRRDLGASVWQPSCVRAETVPA